MSSKATHEGTCQACGSDQKLPDGLLSNHGYTVEWNMFEGTCHGAKELPFEESCDLVKKMITRSKVNLENLVTSRSEVLELTDSKNVYLYSRKGAYSSWEQRELIEVDGQYEYVFTDKEKETHKAFYQGYQLDSKIPYYIGYKSLEEAVKGQNKKYADFITGNIAKTENYIEWQEERVKNWKPRELTPVSKKYTGPKTHIVNAYDIRIEDGKVKYKGRRDSACGRSDFFYKISEFEKMYNENPDHCCKGCVKRFLEIKEVIKKRKSEAS